MRVLLVLWILLTVYLSLYPFDFVPGAPGPRLSFALPQTGGEVIDVFTNLVFYLPLGFLGLAVLQRGSSTATAAVCAFAGVLSLAMELLQVYLPTRYSSLRDVLCNFGGAFAGCMAYRFLDRSRMRVNLAVAGPGPAAWLLIVCWLTWQLFPFLPVFRRIKLYETYAHLFSLRFQAVEFIDVLLAAFALCVFLTWYEGKVDGKARLLVSTPVLLVLLSRSLIQGLTLSDLRLIAGTCGLVLGFTLWRPRRRISWIVLGSVLLVWTLAREVAAPARLSSLSIDIGGVTPDVAAFVRAMAARAFFASATLVTLVRAVRDRPIHSAPVYVYSKEQGGSP